MKSKKSKIDWLDIVFGILGLGLLIRLYQHSIPEASDFEVYWRAIHAWVDGESPYVQPVSAMRGFVFKYPPWILPLFLPFVRLGFEASKWVWTTAQVIAIGYSLAWLIRHGVRRKTAIVVALLFWYMWFAHAIFGQITVFLMAFGLFTWGSLSPSKKESFSAGRVAFFAYLLTSKVFSLVSLMGCWRQVLRRRTLLLGGSIWVGMHLLLLVSSPHFSISNSAQMLIQLYSDWIHAASSGGAELGAKIVRGQPNHGFTAAVLRVLDVDATHVGSDMIVACFLALLLGGLWGKFSRKLAQEEQWAGWLALGVIAHPLAWSHSFVMTYPICALALERALRVGRKGLVVAAIVGSCLIGIVVPQVIGLPAAKIIEPFANKSWGVVICAVVLVLASRKQQVRSNVTV